MKNPKKIVIGLAIVIGLLLILPFLIPTQTYLQQAERIASKKLNAPVTITKANLYLLPSPRVVARGIVIGKNQEVVIERLVLIPTVVSIFSSTKQIDLTITKPVIKKAALALVSALTTKKTQTSEAAAVNIRHINIDAMQLVWPDTKYPLMNAQATLSADNKLELATVESVDGKLKADVRPNGDEQLIMLTATAYTLLASVPLLIDIAKLEMHLKASKLDISNIDIALYGGKLTGKAVVSWDNNWKASGRLTIANLALKQPTNLISKSVYLSGNLFSNGSFSSIANDASRLADNLNANFTFKVNNGVLHGLDLVKVASILLKQSQNGGETQFDAFSGLLNSSGKQYHLRDLKISSGLLSATGQVKIKANKTLDGTGVVDVKNSMGLTGIPLDVSGTVSKPVVLPSKAALAGALAGTAILGPGVGTSVGIKAGGAMDKLKGLFK